MCSELSLFSATRLSVSKIDHAVIVSSRKICGIHPLLSPSILYRHILPLSRLQKISEIALRTAWQPGYGENSFVWVPLLTWPTQVSNLFDAGREPQIYKNGLAMGVKIWGDADKSGKGLIC